MIEPVSIWRPYTQMQTASPAIRAERAEGAWIFTTDGRKILDGISSWWVITHGHCDPRITDAISAQARQLDQVIFADFSHAAAEELAERLSGFLPPSLRHVFFSDNGSTAVEIAIKMALQSCQQSSRHGAKRILTFQCAYHGDTAGAMSVAARSVFTRPYCDMLFASVQAGHATCSTDPVEAFVGHFRELLARHRDELAAVILEPLIQGAGGMVMWPIEAVAEVGRLCRESGVYLIFDEVMTGFGRTGTMFALEQAGIVPDLLCLSKGLTAGSLPLAVTVANSTVYDSFLSTDRGRMLFHGHSFTANPIACAAAAANLRIFSEDDVFSRIRAIERVHRARLERLTGNGLIRDRRVRGAVAAFDLESGGDYLNDFGGQISRRALRSGLHLRPLGPVIYLLPPYCVTDFELNFAWDVIEDAVNGLQV